MSKFSFFLKPKLPSLLFPRGLSTRENVTKNKKLTYFIVCFLLRSFGKLYEHFKLRGSTTEHTVDVSCLLPGWYMFCRRRWPTSCLFHPYTPFCYPDLLPEPTFENGLLTPRRPAWKYSPTLLYAPANPQITSSPGSHPSNRFFGKSELARIWVRGQKVN